MDFSETIKQISQKKDCLTDKAVRAKEEYEQLKNQISDFAKVTVAVNDIRQKNVPTNSPDLINDKLDIRLTKGQKEEIQAFSENVKLLAEIIKKSNIDDLSTLVTSPIKLFILNFFIGLVRGIAFAIGVFLVIFMLTYLLLINLPPNSLRIILGKIF